MALKKETRQQTYAEQIGVNRGAGYDALAQAQLNRSNTIDTLLDRYSTKALQKIQSLGRERATEEAKYYTPTFEEKEITINANGNPITKKVRLLNEPVTPSYLKTDTEKSVYEELAYNQFAKSLDTELKNIIASVQYDAKKNQLDGNQFNILVSQAIQPVLDNLSPNLKKASLLGTQQYIEDVGLNVQIEYDAVQRTKLNTQAISDLSDGIDYTRGNWSNTNISNNLYFDDINKYIAGLETYIATNDLTESNKLTIQKGITRLKGTINLRKFFADNDLLLDGASTLEDKKNYLNNIQQIQILTQSESTGISSLELTRGDGSKVTLSRQEVLTWTNGDVDALNSISNAFSENQSDVRDVVAREELELISKSNGQNAALGTYNPSKEDKRNPVFINSYLDTATKAIGLENSKYAEVDELRAIDTTKFSQLTTKELELFTMYYKDFGQLPDALTQEIAIALNPNNEFSERSAQALYSSGAINFLANNYSGGNTEIEYMLDSLSGNYDISMGGVNLENSFADRWSYYQKWYGRRDEIKPINIQEANAFLNNEFDAIFNEVLLDNSEQLTRQKLNDNPILIGDDMSESTSLLDVMNTTTPLNILKNQIGDLNSANIDDEVYALIEETWKNNIQTKGIDSVKGQRDELTAVMKKVFSRTNVGLSSWELTEGYGPANKISLVMNPAESYYQGNTSDFNKAVSLNVSKQYPKIELQKQGKDLTAGIDYKLMRDRDVSGRYMLYIYNQEDDEFYAPQNDQGNYIYVDLIDVAQSLTKEVEDLNNGN